MRTLIRNIAARWREWQDRCEERRLGIGRSLRQRLVGIGAGRRG
jgi:hypothetical protein